MRIVRNSSVLYQWGRVVVIQLPLEFRQTQKSVKRPAYPHSTSTNVIILLNEDDDDNDNNNDCDDDKDNDSL